MSSEDIEGDEWGAYVTLYVWQGRTWDHLRSARSMVTQAS